MGTWTTVAVGCCLLAAALPLGACEADDEPRAEGGGNSVGAGGSGGSGGAGGDGGSGGSGGSSNPELDAKCTPSFTLELEDTGPKGQIFLDAVGDPEAFVQEVGRRVCRILYREPAEVRDANHITLIIRDDPDYAGWKAGDVGDITVMISTDHLATVQSQGHDVATEIEGVLLHEMTHMYQHDDKAAGEGSYPNLPNVIEGVADFVRIRAGNTPLGAYVSKQGSWDDEGYWKPAYFLLWADLLYPDLLYQLNLGMVAGDGVAWSPAAFEAICGETVDALWTSYQEADCCAGTTTSCCH